MIGNYVRIALRYLLKNRTFSMINLLGLTLGFLCFLLIGLYLQDELSYDSFHRDADRIYRVLQHEKQEDGSVRDLAIVAAQVGVQSKQQIPEVEDAVRIFALGRITMGNDPATRQYEPTLTFDPNFLTFFDFPLVEGDPKTALSQPDGIVISESAAKKYFGEGPLLGKPVWSILRRKDQYVDLTVTGVMKDWPQNSHLQFDILFPPATWPSIFPWYTEYETNDWTSNSFTTYVKLKPGVDIKAVEQKLTAMVKSHYGADQEFKSTFSLQPLKDIHLYSGHLQGNRANLGGTNPFYIYLFGAVSLLILLIASLNYMNLSTAAAYKRTREIGTRKTLGAQRSQLITQFTGEALILSGMSLMLAIAALQALLPLANSFTGKKLALQQLPTTWMLGLVLVMILAGIASSLYPAYIIARVSPSQAMKKSIPSGGGLPVRKLLVAAQFAISILMIASTLVIHQQLRYMREKDLGMSVSDLLVIDINSDRLRRNYEQVKAAFASVPGVLQVSTTTRVPGEWKSFPIARAKHDGNLKPEEMIYVGVDKDFFETYGIKLREGRNFTAGREDSTKVILTQMAVEQLGLENPVGQSINIPSIRWGASVEELQKPLRVEVIGVADNFHFESLRQSMMPVIFAYPNTSVQRIDYYTLNIHTDNWGETLEQLKGVNRKIDADNPLEYTFLNDRFNEFYEADARRGQLFLVFSMVIVLIAILGLFALVSYSMESRTKEIGIRKVLGASIQNILGLVSREFLGIVIVASIVALPAAWLLMNKWLTDFAYRVPLNAGVFLLAALVSLVIAFVTISVRTLRTARANPVDSLRSE
jgi:putative ABC transport system permease protein